MAAVFTAGYVLAFAIHRYIPGERQIENKYTLLAPIPNLIGEWVHHTDLNQIKNEIRQYMNEQGVEYSFYVEHLATGTTIELNEKNAFVAASLLKLPIVIDVMRQVDLGSIQLNQKIELKEEHKDTRYGSLHKASAGTKITVEEAIKRSLVNSDNTATNMLQSLAMDASPNAKILEVLDYNWQYDEQSEPEIDAEAYTEILKCLYYSCFLSLGSSQKILEYMTLSPPNGISSPLPSNIKVAHKIGVARDVKSDCGIIYARENSYSFCLMVNADEKEANRITSHVSKTIYERMLESAMELKKKK